MSEIGSKQNPPPNNIGEEIVPMVIADLEGRKALGEKKYKEVLRVENGRDALLDLYQELLDAVIYIRQRIAQDEAKHTRQAAVVKALQAVEWVYEYSFTCPWCVAPEIEGHKNDCQRQKALEEADERS